MPSLIELKDIVRTYRMGEGEYQALKGVNFTLEHGELVSVVGESGSGKTTLVNILGLLDRPTSGQYFLNGEEVSHYSVS